jgi:hypothetical protein
LKEIYSRGIITHPRGFRGSRLSQNTHAGVVTIFFLTLVAMENNPKNVERKRGNTAFQTTSRKR